MKSYPATVGIRIIHYKDPYLQPVQWKVTLLKCSQKGCQRKGNDLFNKKTTLHFGLKNCQLVVSPDVFFVTPISLGVMIQFELRTCFEWKWNFSTNGCSLQS